MELDLTGIDEVLNDPLPDLDLDLSGVDKVLSPKGKKPSGNRIVFQPENSDWSVEKLSSIKDFFKSNFGKDLPVSVVGQGAIHKRWKLDHRGSADIGIHPDSKEGQKLKSYLEENNIPFLAFKSAIPGVSTSPHFHIGKPSKRTEQDFSLGETEVPQVELDLTGVDELINVDALEEFNLDGVDEVISSESIQDLSLATDPSEVPFTVGKQKVSGLVELITGDSKVKVYGKNPNEMGEIIKTTIDNPTGDKPDSRTVTNAWLAAWNPEYVELNEKFRAETGGLSIALLDDRRNWKFLEGNKLEIQGRPTRGVQALFKAYKEGGLAAFNATNALINQQLSDRVVEYEKNKQALDDLELKHPWAAAAASGIEREAKNIVQLGTNLKYLDKAIAVGNHYGWDSDQYIDLINQEAEEQEYLAEAEAGIYNPPSFAGKVVAGATGGALMLPRVLVAGKIAGPAALPLMTYAENLHRGNREGALAALPMAILVGTGRGLAQFTDINPLGSSAPFRVTRSKLKALEETLAGKESVSIAQLSPLERQLIHRGANALSLQVPTDGTTIQDIAANMIVGIGFPVGKSPRRAITPETAPVITPKVPFQIGQRRIDIPLTSPSLLGKFPVVEQQREIPPVVYPSAESPNTTKYGEPFDPTAFVGETETGFQARTTGATLHLDLDTANLNLLELKRTLEESSYITKGDTVADQLSKQKAIKNAISILETAIPEETKVFFAENEAIIREALRTNQEARNAKREIKERLTQTPSEVKSVIPDTPKIETGKESARDIFAGKAGDSNQFTSQEKAHEILNNFFKITTQGTLKSTALPYADVIARKSADLAYLSAFYIEDFYHRGIVPTVELIHRKLSESIGSFSSHLKEEISLKAFQDGMDFYNANNADPFFSKMKQAASERLPNSFKAQQARDILSNFPMESQWTIGLDEFLRENEGRKIKKQELIEVINRGQVRVEEKILDDARRTQINKQLDELRKELVHWEEEAAYRDTKIEQAPIAARMEELENELNRIGNTKYSLRAYTQEQLELPGAVNSKEVLLISPEGNEGANTLYRSPHWQGIPNVVAHYRANDRISINGKRLYHSEEFQSDWNHDIREEGLKGKFTEADSNRALELTVKENKIGLTVEEQIELNKLHKKSIGEIEPNPFMSHNWKELVLKRFIRDAVVARNPDFDPNAKVVASSFGQGFLIMHHGQELLGTEGTGFARKGWATRAEAENILKQKFGEYKYDAVSWTTAIQQMERYGKILEGKNFKWRKNSDGTYTFGLKGPIQGAFDSEGFNYPHELDNISLERFAELTTKEAADFVREQEAEIRKQREANDLTDDNITHEEKMYGLGYKGKFNLAEAVNIRKEGSEKYADYDVALVNMVKKIGKRFGAKYSKEEIETVTDTYSIEPSKGIEGRWNIINDRIGTIVANKGTEKEAIAKVAELNSKKFETVHSLEITPEMRRSLSKEGQPLYGLGSNDPLKSPELGIRNQITTVEAFNSHRDSLVKSLEENALIGEERRAENIRPTTPAEVAMQTRILNADKVELEAMRENLATRKGTVFNSGLSPEAFIDQAKLLYRGMEDFAEFSSAMLKRFGEQVKPYLQDLWIEVKDLAKKFNEDERGFFNLTLRRQKPLAEIEYEKKKQNILPYSMHRGVTIAQLDDGASIVYDIARMGQRDKNAFEDSVLVALRAANKSIEKTDHTSAAEAIFIGNENSRLYTDAELAAGDVNLNRPALNPEQILAYKEAYRAEHINLEKRKQQVLFSYKERAQRLNARLANFAPGTTQHTAILTSMINLNDAMVNVDAHYEMLKNTGYISLKRKGPIAAFVQDPAFPVGDKRGEVYRQFQTKKEAGIWIAEQERLLNANPVQSAMYDINNPQRLRAAAAKLTPAQFEDLIDSAGVNPRSKDIEDLRDEIYSRFPSAGYQLKRDFVRGYDRTWNFVVESISDQTEAYANSFYSRVAGEHMIKALEASGLQQNNTELYRVMQKYIDHEIASPERTRSAEIFGKVRKGVYLFQLGFDLKQLYLNALAQPITQTYSYFARVEHNGNRLKGLEPEKYFKDAWKLAGNVARDYLQGTNTADPEFVKIRQRLINEGVVTPEFNKALLEGEVQKTVGAKLNTAGIKGNLEHWAGTFMRAGEITTRTHAAAEAYLVGKNKFGLKDEELVTFIVRAIDATQTNPSRAEAPLLVRGSQNDKELRKLLYQFNAFSHMWMENLALGVKADFKNRRLNATARHLGAVSVLGGISGLPLSGFAAGLYTLITGDDPRKKFKQLVGDNSYLERTAMYGITQHATISQSVGAQVPFVEDIGNELIIQEKTIPEVLSLSRIPAFSTAGQIAKGFNDLRRGDTYRGLGQVLPLKPLRNIATAARFEEEGIKTRKGTTIVPKSKVTFAEKMLQVAPGISPSRFTEYYEEQNRKKRNTIIRKLRRKLS